MAPCIFIDWLDLRILLWTVDNSTVIIYKQTRASLVGKLRAITFAVELLKVQAIPVVGFPPHPLLPSVHALVTWSKEIIIGSKTEKMVINRKCSRKPTEQLPWQAHCSNHIARREVTQTAKGMCEKLQWPRHGIYPPSSCLRNRNNNNNNNNNT